MNMATVFVAVLEDAKVRLGLEWGRVMARVNSYIGVAKLPPQSRQFFWIFEF